MLVSVHLPLIDFIIVFTKTITVSHHMRFAAPGLSQLPLQRLIPLLEPGVLLDQTLVGHSLLVVFGVQRALLQVHLRLQQL